MNLTRLRRTVSAARVRLWAVMVLMVFAQGSCAEGRNGGPVSNIDWQPAIQSDSSLADELARLEALPAPAGADKAIFAALKTELANMLKSQGVERFTSAPPMLPGSSAHLSWDSDNSTLEWGYCCLGDYNQNSLVEVADITPLGVNWGAKSSSFPAAFPYSAELAVVDGNANGMVEIADITPIGQNFQVRVAAYNIYFSTAISDYPRNPDSGNGNAALLGTVTFPEGPAPAGQRRLFSFKVTEPQPETYFWVRPTDGSSEGIPSNCYYLAAPANKPPVVSLTADPLLGDIPMLAEFDASASYDPDGEITKYEWDWDGPNGGWAWEDTGTTAVVEHTFEETGIYPVTMRVTDNQGGISSTAVQINATTPGNDPPIAVLVADPLSGAVPLTVHFNAEASSDIDGTIVNYEWDLDGDGIPGEPGYEATAAGSPTATFMYVAAGIYTASVKVTDDAGADSSAHQQIEPREIGTGEWVFVTLDSLGISGDQVSSATVLEVIDGKPAISYGAGENWMDLHPKYIRSTTTTGKAATDWTEPVYIDPNAIIAGEGTALVCVEGHPAITYLDYSSENTCKYVRSTTVTGDSPEDWNERVVLATGTAPASWPRIAVVDGNPAVTYNKSGQLQYVRSTTSTGSNASDWSQIVTLASGMPERDTSNIAIVEGNPAVTYAVEAGGGELKSLYYRRSSTITGTSSADWGGPILILDDLAGWSPNEYSILQIVNGNPAFICKRVSGATSFYMRSLTATGENSADWQQCAALDNRHNFGGTFDFTNIDGGLAFAYAGLETVRLGVYYIEATGDGTEQSDWSNPVTLAEEDYRIGASMAEVNGNPAMVLVESFTYGFGTATLVYAYYDR